jgi:polyhydroxybutyrate depolymerase
MKRFALAAGAFVLAACGLALAPLPAAAQDSSAAQRAKAVDAKKKAVQKKPAPNKKAQAKPAPKKKPPPAPKKAPPKPPPPQPQSAGPRASTDTESSITRPGDHNFSIQHGGLTRSYRVHVPPGYSMATPAPLVVLLHGSGAGADMQGNEAHYGLAAKSDREGFIAVFPTASSRSTAGRPGIWNAGGAAREQGPDDVGFVAQVVMNVFRQMSIDRGRIFAAGMSEGGTMAYRLACDLPGMFKAVASIGGSDNTRGCTPAAPVSVLHIHAKDDPQVAFASAPETASRWAQLNGCTAQPRRILEQNGAYCEAYAYCLGRAEVQLCATEQGGHSWPGGRPARGAPAASQALSATNLIWEFFSRR